RIGCAIVSCSSNPPARYADAYHPVPGPLYMVCHMSAPVIQPPFPLAPPFFYENIIPLQADGQAQTGVLYRRRCHIGVSGPDPALCVDEAVVDTTAWRDTTGQPLAQPLTSIN